MTVDAMGCQKAVAEKILAKEADYALMVKNNQPTLAAAVEGFFEAAGLRGRGAHAGRVGGEGPRADRDAPLRGAGHLGAAVRGHWGVENGLHWSLDVAYGEDQARMREGNAAENFSILRRIPLNLIRLDKTRKTGVKLGSVDIAPAC